MRISDWSSDVCSSDLNVRAETLMPIVLANVAREARVMTDEHSGYRDMTLHFAGHGTTSHGAGQYVDLADRTIHSNTAEGRSAERRVGEGCGRTGSTWWAPEPQQKKLNTSNDKN